MADAGSFNADLGVNLQFNVDGAGLVEMSRTIKEISKGKDLQRYWKDVETATDNAGKAIERYSRNVNSQGLAESFLKQINALKAITQKENLSELFPNMDINFDELIESAKKVAPRISSEFSVSNFEQAFKTFDLLRDKGIELGEVFSRLADYVNVVKRNSELDRENSEFRNLLGDTDIEKLKKDLGELQKLRLQAEREFESFLNINKIERKDFWGDEKFSEYFTEIRNGSMTATDAIARFKTEYGYLLEESFKTNGDTFGIEQLQAFSNKLDSIFRQVEETSTKINDIISNGVITKSVENLSTDSSLSDSQRSLFGNLLQDEESLKSITALFQKLIEESNKTSKVDLFNDEQLQQVLSIFDRIENSLSSLRSVISDIGDGEEFSPLLKMINNVQSSISELATSVKGIGINMNIDVGSDSEMEAKVQSKIANALQAYQRLFDHIKMSSVGGSVINTNFFEFDINQYDTMMGKLQAYKKFIDNMRKEAKTQFNGKDVLYQNTEKSYWTQASAAMAQVTKAFNEMNAASNTNPLKDLFGSGDLSEVVSQLGLIVVKLEEISTTASSFKEVFTNGFNVTASVEEIDKLTNRVKELEDELSKIKLNPVSVDKSNISSENPTVEVSQNDEVTASIRKKKEELASYELQLEETRYEIEKLSKSETEAYGFSREYSGKKIESLRNSVTDRIFGEFDSISGKNGTKKWLAMDNLANITTSTLKSYQMWQEELQKVGYTLSEIRQTSVGLEADILPIDGKAITNAEEFRKALDSITTVPSENIELLNKQITELESKISSLKSEISSLESSKNPPIKDVFQGDDEEKSIDTLKAKIKEIFTDVDDLKQVLKSLDEGSYFDLSWVKDSVDTDNEAKVQSLIKVLEEYGYTIKNLKNDSEAWSTSGSIVSLSDENDKLEKITASAKDAATSKEKFAKANKEVKASADSSTPAINKESDALKSEWDRNVKAIQDYMDAVTKLNNLNAKDKGTGKYASQIALQEKNVEELKEKALEARTAITSMINPHDVPLNTWRDYLDVMEKFSQASLGSAESVAKLEDALRKMDFSSLESAGTKFKSQFDNLSIKPDGDHQFLSWTNDLKELNAKIDEYNSKVKYLKDNNIVDGEQVVEVKNLRDEIEEIINVMTKTPQTKRGWTDIGASKAAEKVANVLKQNTKMSKEAKDAIRAYYNELRRGNPSQPIDEILVKVNQLVQKERELGRVGKSFVEIFKEKVIYGGAAQLAGMFGFYDVINIGREGFQTIRELDTALTEMKKVSDETTQSLKNYQSATFDVGDAVGATAKTIQDSTADWMRLGESIDEAAESAKVSNILLNVSEFENIDEATKSLVSMSQAYQELEKIDIVNKINNIGNNFSISTDELARGMQNAAAVLKTQGNDIDKAISLITAGNAITQNAEKTSAGIRTIALRIAGKFIMPEYTVMYRNFIPVSNYIG